MIEDDRIVAVGDGPGAATGDAPRASTAAAASPRPGLVNCHHHLYQWATRGLAQQATLFEWLVELYPVWAHVDAEVEWAAARAGLAALARSGCSTSTDHHYVFPAGAGDLLEVEIEAARGLGVRFHPCRGSMDLGQSDGGLPPDEVVEDRDAILAASEAAIDRFHDPAPGAMVRVALAPCSPFSVTPELMAETAQLARRRGVRLHTHLAETLDEEVFCQERFGVRPVQYLEDLGWLGDDVWLAHCVHLERRGGRPLRRHRHRRGALPELQRAPGRGHRAGGRPHARRRARRPRGRRRRVQRGRRAGRRAARGAARTRAWPAARPR